LPKAWEVFAKMDLSRRIFATSEKSMEFWGMKSNRNIPYKYPIEMGMKYREIIVSMGFGE
jgi:hypothetical protein